MGELASPHFETNRYRPPHPHSDEETPTWFTCIQGCVAMTSVVQQSNLCHIVDEHRITHTSPTVLPPSRRAQSFSMSSPAAALMNCLSNSEFGNLRVSNACSTNSVKLSNLLSSSREHRRLDRSVSEPVTAGDCQNNNVVNSQQQQNQQASHNPAVNSSRYKTELCRPFDENGSCKYGEKCQFAHGIHELRTLARHPKYKTELCRTFHTVGFCPYGPRCHFIHNEDERKLNSLVNANQQANNARGSASPPQPQQLQQLQQSRHITSVQQSRFPLGSLSSLGSSASDSNPSSLSSGSPPSLSPTFTGSEDLLASSSSSTCGHNSPPSRYSPVFNFNHEIPPASSFIAPLNVQTQEVSIENLMRSLEVYSDEEEAHYHRIHSHSHSPVDSGAYTGSRPSSSSYGPATPESISGESVSSGGCRSPPLAPVAVKSGCSVYRLPCFDQFRSVC